MTMVRSWTFLVCFGLMAGACGDDASSDEDGAESDGGTPDAAVEAPRCSSDLMCDNGLFCDGEEVCVGGACQLGLPVRCDDGIECTLDKCSEALRGCESVPVDLDGDGHVDGSCLGEDGEPIGDDCDDADPLRFPGNIETCDEKDDDCNPDTLGERDMDGDGVQDALCCNGDNCGEDCDDFKPSVGPTATEACDRFDNDCDGKVDEGVSVDVFPDADRDGHGATTGATKHCPGSVGFALVNDDCDDDDPEVFEGQFEICDQKDNNCDGQEDEIHQDAPWFLDLDEDTFGDPASTPIFSCARVIGRVLSHNDCRDDEPAIHPAAAEACDGVDNDCNGLKDFNLDVNDFEDDDDDDLADDGCGAGAPDCDDRNSSTGAGLDEICDLIDNDCDDKVDEQTAQTVWYSDRDGDGWGVDQGTALARCEPIPGRASNLGDCNDGLNAVHPDADESCNGVDEDCDGHTDEATDHLCALTNAVAGCNFGACDVLACFPGYDSADGLDSNGCEAVVALEPTGGTCMGPYTDSQCDDGYFCTGREVCISGVCYYGTAVNCSGPNVLQGSHTIENSLDIAELAGIGTITGDLLIQGTTALHALTGLGGLNVIGGNLIITDTGGLTSLSGLSGLTTVGGQIKIVGNTGLTDPDLPALVSAGSILIQSNIGLTDVAGFGTLATVYGRLQVLSNPALTDVSGFGALQSTGWLQLEDNPLLTDTTGFGALATVLADLEIHRNAHMAIAFAKLKDVGGSLDLSGVDYDNDYPPNYTTTSISLPELDHVGGHLTINDLQNLVTLELPKLRQVEKHFSLAVLESLAALSLPTLRSVGGLLVSYDSVLSSLSVPKLEYAATDLVEVDPYGVADGDLRIQGTNIDSLSFPELLAVDGVFSVYGSSDVMSISAPKLHTVGGDFYISYLDQLTSLSAGALTTVGGTFDVSSCYALTTLQLQLLATVGGDLYIDFNDVLPTIADLGLRDASSVLQLQVLGSYAEIYYNGTLCTPEADAFVAALVTNGFAGSPYVSGNNDLCQ